MEKTPNTPTSQLTIPPFSQLFLFFLCLGWLVLVPVIGGGIIAFLPAAWPDLANTLLSVGLVVVLLLPPLLGLIRLIDRNRWFNLQPPVLALLAAVVYIVVALIIRGTVEPGTVSESILRLTVLTAAALGIAGGVFRWAGALSARFWAVLGMGLPSLSGLLLVLTPAALLTIGWPITGALGDSWISLLIVVQALAISLPEEILFRGGVFGLLAHKFEQRKALAVFLSVLIYVAFTPSMVLPHNDWSRLLLLVTAIPFAVLVTGLRLVTGTIWAGLLFAWVYRAAPQLFTDPRVELPLITQPWQTLAHLWMVVGAGGAALALGLGWRWLRGPMFRRPAVKLAATGSGAIISWTLWLGVWAAVGHPGFYNDGFLIIMAEQADLSGAEEIEDLVARRAFVRERLIETAEGTQGPVWTALEAVGLPYRPFYIINMIRVDGNHRRMAEFAGLPGVARVMLNPNVRPYPVLFSPQPATTPEDPPEKLAWNVDRIEADEVWAMGVTGRGVVVAGQDTGYDWRHPALHRAYRGYEAGDSARHDYNWHDAWAETLMPFDDEDHGTHTMGAILGDDGQGHQIGVAPAATWIGCRNMRRGLGNPASYADCMEFFLAPYPLGGEFSKDGDVSMAPHVVNNSWGCPDKEGCDDDVLEAATAALRAAGIMMVVSAGNEGPGCGTVAEPPARYDNVLSVGATGRMGAVTGFSSRGPVSTGASAEMDLLKPDVVAPGDNIRSSVPGGGYESASGTSMAGPHVTGLVALIWSANPDLVGQIEETEDIIRQSARPTEVTLACGPKAFPSGDAPLSDALASLSGGNACACGGVTGRPNNVYGWGEIDALAAVMLALERK